ncbi:MAG: hypothetical protein DRI86_06560 [Bacteroidetes bacterium]|nr:MAG: hypothetical protein DRI86_06560 [Bacteroidota bacterium]
MDNNIFVKVTKVLMILFMVAGVVFTALVIVNSEDMKTNMALADKILNPTFGLGYFLLGLGILVTLAFAVAQMIASPKSALMVVISLASLGIIYFVAYMSASNNIDAQVYQDFNINSVESKIIGSLIYLVYFLGGLSILAIIYSGINTFLLKR